MTRGWIGLMTSRRRTPIWLRGPSRRHQRQTVRRLDAGTTRGWIGGVTG
jgi:hypothetical protein